MCGDPNSVAHADEYTANDPGAPVQWKETYKSEMACGGGKWVRAYRIMSWMREVVR